MSASELAEAAEEEERRKKRAPWGVIALVLLTGLALIRNGSGEFDVGPPQPASAAAADSRVPGAAFAGHPQPLPYSAPDRVRIPAIQVDAPIMPVGLDADGWVGAPPPEDPNLAGWFTGAVSPGEKGTAVVVGHVDNQTGPRRVLRTRGPEEGKSRRGRRGRTERPPSSRSTASRSSRRTTSPATVSTRPRAPPNCGSSPAAAVSPSTNGYDGNVVAFARLVEVR